MSDVSDERLERLPDPGQPAAGAATSMVLVYATFPDHDQAAGVGETLVIERLAGCINIVSGMTAIYVWEGRIERASEVILLAKTVAHQADACAARIAALHSYDTPAVLVLPVLSGHRPYLEWLAAGCNGATTA